MQQRLVCLRRRNRGFPSGRLAYYAPRDGDAPPLGAAMPILRDNFWLAVHVVTIMASYASAAIALILGNIALGYYLSAATPNVVGVRRARPVRRGMQRKGRRHKERRARWAACI